MGFEQLRYFQLLSGWGMHPQPLSNLQLFYVTEYLHWKLSSKNPVGGLCRLLEVSVTECLVFSGDNEY